MSSTAIPKAQGRYVPAVRHRELIFVSGMTPRRDGVLLQTGAIDPAQSPEIYADAVRLAASNALSAARSYLAMGEVVFKILSFTVYINAPQNFTEHSKIADIASDFFEEVLGSDGIGSRTTVGVSSLPGNAPIELQIIALVE